MVVVTFLALAVLTRVLMLVVVVVAVALVAIAAVELVILTNMDIVDASLSWWHLWSRLEWSSSS